MKSLHIPSTGYNIAADWYDSTKPEVLLVLTGYESNKAKYRPLVEAITAKTGMHALVLDYSGHGESPFELMECRPAQHFMDVICAFDWLKREHPDLAINVMGTSLGGFLATQLTKYRTFQKLVLRVPALYKPEDFYTVWADIDRDWTRDVFRKDAEAMSHHPLLARASRFAGKTLVVVHEFDEMVPKETTDAFIKAFSPKVYVAEGFRHSFNDPANPKDKVAAYHEAIASFLNGEEG